MLLNDLTTKVSNYNRRPMEKTYFSILLFLVFITSLLCQDYQYDENYDYYNENYDYYGHQNLLAPAPPPPFIPPTLPPRTGNYMLIMIRFMENNNYTYLLLQ